MKRYLYLVALMALSACAGNVKNDEQSLEEKAKALHAEMVTIDTHTDTPLNFLREGFDFSGENNSAIGSKVDLRKMEEGGLDAAFFAVFIGQRECTPEGYKKANEKALKIFNAIHESVAKYSDRAEVATSPDDVYRLKKEGKRAIYIGVENGFPIGED